MPPTSGSLAVQTAYGPSDWASRNSAHIAYPGWRSLLAGDPARHPQAGEHYLVFVENGVADSGHEHHRDQEGNKAAVGHGVQRIFDQELGGGR